MSEALAPSTFEEAAGALRRAAAAGRSVRLVGGGTKLHWGAPTPDPYLQLRTDALGRIVEHNAGDLTAVLEAGVQLARAQEAFASEGQMLALDPPLGADSDLRATIGGVVATGDCGPVRHRYGTPRDLVVGMTVALSDGTIARSGGKVIKNVAGYDVAKLFAGSFGTLGMILSVNVRLHPIPVATATALGCSADPELLAAAAVALSAAPLELEALDVGWRAGGGRILARAGGAQAPRRAERVAQLMRDSGLEQLQIDTEDERVWAEQRAGQRSPNAALVRVASRPSALASVLGAAQACDGALVGRAALGSSFIALEPEAVPRLCERLPPGAVCVLLDAPAERRAELDPWGLARQPALELMRRVKLRFDPAGACNPGVFVGGI